MIILWMMFYRTYNFLKFETFVQIYAKKCSALFSYFEVTNKTTVKETSSISVVT